MGRSRCAQASRSGRWAPDARPVFGLPDQRLTGRLPGPRASGCACRPWTVLPGHRGGPVPDSHRLPILPPLGRGTSQQFVPSGMLAPAGPPRPGGHGNPVAAVRGHCGPGVRTLLPPAAGPPGAGRPCDTLAPLGPPGHAVPMGVRVEPRRRGHHGDPRPAGGPQRRRRADRGGAGRRVPRLRRRRRRRGGGAHRRRRHVLRRRRPQGGRHRARQPGRARTATARWARPGCGCPSR